MTEDTESGMGTSCNVHDIPEVCLEHIFRHVSFKDKVKTLPLVCKRWNNVLGKPSVCWQELQLSKINASLNLPQNTQSQRNTLAWFTKRASAVRLLFIKDLSPSAGEHFWFYSLPYLCPTLRSIRVENSVLPHSFYSFLPQCCQLTSLDFTLKLDEYSRLTAHGLLHTLRFVPKLTTLALYQRTKDGYGPGNSLCSFPEGLAGTQQLQSLIVHAQLLPSTAATLVSLRHLVLSGLVDAVFPEPLVSLVNLKWLELRWVWCRTRTCLTLPATVTRMSSLSALSLRNIETQQDGNGECLENLSGLVTLTSLEVVDCRLNYVPLVLSTLSNLQHLSLAQNAIITLPDWITKCTGLSCLDLDLQNVDLHPLVIPPSITSMTQLERFCYRGDCDTCAVSKLSIWLRNGLTVGLEVDWEVDDYDELYPHMTMAGQECKVTVAHGPGVYERLHDITPYIEFLGPRMRHAIADAEWKERYPDAQPQA